MSKNEEMKIVKFLEARIAEDETIARGVADGPGRTENSGYWSVTIGVNGEDAAFAHVGTNPDRILAECAAKRAIIAEEVGDELPTRTDAELHRFGMHPAYEYVTTEGQRKNWDDIDTPPEGAGWERNTEAGRDGWDRLDYTEESYWRRLRVGGPRKPYVPKALRILATVYADHPDYRQEWAL